MTSTDVVKHAADRAAHAIIEGFGRIGMNNATGILPLGMADRVVCSEGLAHGHERLPLIAHEMGRKLHSFAEHPAGFAFRQIVDDSGPGFAGRRALRQFLRPLDPSSTVASSK